MNAATPSELDDSWVPGYDRAFRRCRWHDPHIGRFVSMDDFEGSISDPMSLHKYLYANVNPIHYVDPTGNVAGIVEFLATNKVRFVKFAMRAGPVLRVGFGAWDAVTVLRIGYKALSGQDVSIWDWVQFGAASLGLVTAVPGTQRLALWTMSRMLQGLKIDPALRTFEGARLAVGKIVKLEPIKDIEYTAAGTQRFGQFVVHEFGGTATPAIRYFKTGDALFDADTLIHELFHYAHWVMRGKPTGAAFDAFKDITMAIDHVAINVAKFVLELAKL